jgi:hypothetical protein
VDILGHRVWGARFFVGVITLYRDSLALMRTYVISHRVMCLESIHIFLALVHYSFTILNMEVSQFIEILCIPKHGSHNFSLLDHILSIDGC